jgi:hypothetical protein
MVEGGTCENAGSHAVELGLSRKPCDTQYSSATSSSCAIWRSLRLWATNWRALIHSSRKRWLMRSEKPVSRRWYTNSPFTFGTRSLEGR